MGQDGVSQRGVGEPCHHRDLDGRHNLPGANTERGEAKARVAVGLGSDNRGAYNAAGLQI